MLNNLIDIVAIIVIFYYILKKQEQYSWLLYVSFSCIMPWFVLGSYRISFEILMFVPMFLMYLLQHSYRKCIHFSITEVLLISLLIYSIIISLSREVYDNYINLYRFFSAFRFIVIIYIIKELFDDDVARKFDKLVLVMLMLNIIVIVIQSIFPSETMHIWTQLYDSPSRAALENDFLKFGYMSRPVGTLGSPTILGMFNCIFSAYLVGRFVTKKIDVKIFSLGFFISCFIAVSSFSKTAILSWAIYAFILCLVLFTRKLYSSLLMLLFIPVCILIAYINFFPDNASHAMTMLELFADPNSAFNTRFGDKGSTWGALSMVLNDDEYFIFGVNREYANIFVGDVLYVEQLYRFGIIGTIWYILCLWVPMLIALRKKNIQVLINMSALFLVGLASPSQYWFLSAFMIGVSIKLLQD